MAKKVAYEDELKKKLKEYGNILEQLDKLTAMKEQIRGQLKQWLGINNLTEHCIYDENDQCWKLSFNSSSRRKVADWGELRLELGDRYNELIQVNESVSFMAKKVKKPT